MLRRIRQTIVWYSSMVSRVSRRRSSVTSGRADAQPVRVVNRVQYQPVQPVNPVQAVGLCGPRDWPILWGPSFTSTAPLAL